MIVKYNNAFYDDWQNGILKYGELYHDIRWQQVLKNTYGLHPEYYVNIENDKIIGGFPAFRVRDKLISLPHLNYCGEFGEFSVDDLGAMTNCIIYSKKIIYDPTEICNDDYVTMRLDLPRTKEELWNLIGPKARNLIRKAKKSNFRLENSSIDNFYNVYCKATNELGTPPHNKKLFDIINELFNEITHVKIMWYNGNIVSCVFEMDFNGIRYDMWAFSIKKYFHLSPNMYLYYELIKNAVTSNIRTYDFGRSCYNGGTYYFKKQWKSKPFKLSYCLYSRNNNSPTRKELKAMQSVTLSSVWSRTPSIVANYIGPYIRKYVY
jgi:hypothetical protein